MPFKSERQRRWMWANRPDIARRWTERYGSSPRGEKSRKKKSKKRRKGDERD